MHHFDVEVGASPFQKKEKINEYEKENPLIKPKVTSRFFKVVVPSSIICILHFLKPPLKKPQKSKKCTS
jgi:hypothetical protein